MFAHYKEEEREKGWDYEEQAFMLKYPTKSKKRADHKIERYKLLQKASQ